MVVLLVVLGAGLITLGTVVLLLFPDRPGGTIRFHSVEVGSKGAGLPLIVLGAALAVAAAAIPDSGASSPSTTPAGQPSVPGLDAAPQTDCTTKFFAEQPPVQPTRVRSVELDAKDRRVLVVGEQQDTEFGMVFSDTLSAATPRVLGAMKLSRRTGAGFHVTGLVNEQTCQPVTLALAADPGLPAPAALGNYIWVTFTFAGEPYSLLLNSSNGNTEVLVTLNRRK